MFQVNVLFALVIKMTDLWQMRKSISKITRQHSSIPKINFNLNGNEGRSWILKMQLVIGVWDACCVYPLNKLSYWTIRKYWKGFLFVMEINYIYFRWALSVLWCIFDIMLCINIPEFYIILIFKGYEGGSFKIDSFSEKVW